MGKYQYFGTDGALKWIQSFPTLIEDRFESEDEYQYLDSYEKSVQIRKKEKPRITLGYYPFEGLTHIPITSQEYKVFVASEGVGKTRIAVRMEYEILKNGHDILYMTGESGNEKIRYLFVSTHLFVKFGLRYTWLQVKEALSPEPKDLTPDQIAEIRSGDLDFYSDGSLGRIHLYPAFTYERVYSELSSKLKKYPQIKHITVDHTRFLKSDGSRTSKGYLQTEQERINELTRAVVVLTGEFNVGATLLSHPNSECMRLGRKAPTNIAAYSSDVTRDATDVWHIYQDQDLIDNNAQEWIPKKARESNDMKNIVLERDLGVQNLIYKEELQIVANKTNLKDVGTLLQ